ncbi:MAG: retropepsin-like domain-containing protein [Proteobacteria bacterium]|nr:retropepsin-like domain-containing protein [Pseudomonadota bacterium]
MSRPLILAAAVAGLLAAGPAFAAPLTVPFDFSRGEVELQVAVKGKPLHMLIDTGVAPSMISLAQAKALGLKVDPEAGEADGIGDGKGASMFGSAIERLSLGGRRFGRVEALALDTGPLSAQYGRPLDGVLGWSFLRDKAVLIDYPNRRLSLIDRPSQAKALTRSCRRRWSAPMALLKDQNWPMVPDFHLGGARLPATLDTGASGGVTLYQGALDLPGVRDALTRTGEGQSTGARGASRLTEYVFSGPVGFGRFDLPGGSAVSLRQTKGSAETSLANIGNRFFADLKLKLLLDYRHRRIGVFADCA